MSLLISAIMPSFRSPEVVMRAIRCFEAQTYGPKELIVLRPEQESVCALEALAWTDSRTCVHLPPGLSIGELRNVACRIARGSVIAFWDDDDISAPDRLARSMEHIDQGADLVGSSRAIYTDGTRRWIYDGAHLSDGVGWQSLVGGTLCYRRRLWEKHPFEDVTTGEDVRFLAKMSGDRVVDLKDESLYLAYIGPDNTSKKDTEGPGWTAL